MPIPGTAVTRYRCTRAYTVSVRAGACTFKVIYCACSQIQIFSWYILNVQNTLPVFVRSAYLLNPVATVLVKPPCLLQRGKKTLVASTASRTAGKTKM